MTGIVDARDQQGHQWRETIVKDLFPLVCARCLTRSDRGAAWLPCDALVVSTALSSSGEGGK
jgi:hypothetical protein